MGILIFQKKNLGLLRPIFLYFKNWAQNSFWACLVTLYKISACWASPDPFRNNFLGPNYFPGSSGPKLILGHLGLGLSHTEAQLPLETLAIRVWALDRCLGRGRRRVTEAAARGGARGGACGY